MRARSLLRWCEYVLWAVGIIGTAYAGGTLLYARLDQAYLNWRFDRARHGTFANEGSVVGRLEIPRLDLSAMILEGTKPQVLRRAVGHISGTALPGESGNIAIAGHRDTFFRSLRNIRRNDEVLLTTLDHSYRYRVESLRVVTPDEIEVLRETRQPVLTLVTCYPFNLVGSAPDRLVVRAVPMDRSFRPDN